MSKAQIEKRLKKITYPGLDKSLVTLKIVKDIQVRGKSVKITLSMANEELFGEVEKRVKDALGEYETEVVFAAQKQKSTNYGSTQNPNNRAKYAKKIVAVSSGKGGVGKSTVAVNLAVGLAQEGKKVGLLDADVYGPSVPRMMQLEHEKLRWNEKDKIVPAENFGIKMMSVGLTTPQPDTPLVWRSSVAVSALIQFLDDVDWGQLDILVIDMPPGTGDVQLTMAQELNLSAAVVVTTPQQISVDDVSRSVMMFKDIHVPIAGIVENMSYFIAPDTGKQYDIFGTEGGRAIAEKYGVDLLGAIPLTMDIRRHSDEGKVPVAFGNDEEKGYYKAIVEKLLAAL